LRRDGIITRFGISTNDCSTPRPNIPAFHRSNWAEAPNSPCINFPAQYALEVVSKQITYELCVFNAAISKGFGVAFVDDGIDLTSEASLNKLKPKSCMKINEKLGLCLVDEDHFISLISTLWASRTLPSAALLRLRRSSL
jgi:hypothetical protein